MASELVVIGLSHHTAPLAIRERLSVRAEQRAADLEALRTQGHFDEALLVSTCNRVEVYGSAEDPVRAAKAAREYLSAKMPGEPLDEFLYELWGTETVRHAFRVTSSLDSMVVGEPQILGQVKEAYEAANGNGAIGAILGRCFTRAFSVAKRVRSETGIAEGSVSVSSIAAELAAKIFGELEGRRVVLVGAGKMGEAAARSLAKSGARLRVVNRSRERAVRLAQASGGEPVDFEMLAQELVAADVVISSTGSERFIITADLMKDVVRARKRRPVFLIDIAVPRDIDPRVGENESIFLYDLDDLQQVANENIAHRRREAQVAERLVAAEVASFEEWYRSLELTPTIIALRERFQEVMRSELQRTLPRLSSLSDSERKSLERMCDAAVSKLLHSPLSRLKEGSRSPDGPQLIDTARRLFDLDREALSEDAAETTSDRAQATMVQLSAASNRSGDSS